MKKWTWILIAVVLVGLIGGTSVLYDQLSDDYVPQQMVTQPTETQSAEPHVETTQAVVNLAPDFTVTDRDGNAVKLSDFFGKPIVLNFWASWCGPCKYEMPDFEEAYKELGEDVVFLMVNLTDGYSETVGSAKAFLEEAGYTFPVYFDTLSEGAMTYQVYSIPCTYFLDRNGALVTRNVGMITGEALRQGIEMIVAE